MLVVHNDMGEGVEVHAYKTSSEGFGKLICWISLVGEGLVSRIYFSKQDRLTMTVVKGEVKTYLLLFQSLIELNVSLSS